MKKQTKRLTAKVNAKSTAAKPLAKRKARLKAKSGEMTAAEIIETIEAYSPRKRQPALCSAKLWEREETNIKRLIKSAATNDSDLPVAASLSALTMLLVWAEKEESLSYSSCTI